MAAGEPWDEWVLVACSLSRVNTGKVAPSFSPFHIAELEPQVWQPSRGSLPLGGLGWVWFGLLLGFGWLLWVSFFPAESEFSIPEDGVLLCFFKLILIVKVKISSLLAELNGSFPQLFS